MQSPFWLRPSSADTWAHCPGSVAMAARYPEEEGPEAAEGTAAHWAATETLQGRAIDATAPNAVAITDEMIEGAALYTAAVLERIPFAAINVEQALPAPEIHPFCGGTSDTWGRGHEPYVIHVVDYKFGFGFVEVFENWQLLTYVSQALSELIRRGEWSWEHEPHTLIELTIVQPRSYHRDGPVRSWRVRLTDLRAHFNQLRAAAEEATKPNATTRVGDYCKHCPARHACVTLQAAALDACDVAGKATPFDLSPVQTGNELRRMHYAQKLMKARIDGLEVQALAMIRQGKGVPHYAAEPTLGRLTWKDGLADSVLMIGDALGKDLRRPVTPITPTQAKATGIDAAVIAEYAHRPRGETKLVPFDSNQTRKIFGGIKA